MNVKIGNKSFLFAYNIRRRYYLQGVPGRDALAATLGTEPQVVLLAFSLLVRHGINIERCLVFHTSPSQPDIQRALRLLKKAWSKWSDRVPLELKSFPVNDLDSPDALRQVYRVLHEGIQNLKKAGFSVHLSISGGRKPISIAAFLTAQFLFSSSDHIWYLYTPPGEEDTDPAQLLQNPRVRLIDLPVPVWTDLPLLLHAVSQYHDPWTAAEVQRSLVQQADQSRLAELFHRKLSKAEKEVVCALVLHGGTNKDIAKKLGKSPKTVSHQLASIYRKLREELGDVAIDRTAVASVFAPILRIGQMTEAKKRWVWQNHVRR